MEPRGRSTRSSLIQAPPLAALALVAVITLTAVLVLYASVPAGAEPLSPSSPLYSPNAPLLDENPDVTADYRGTIKETYDAPAIDGALEHRTLEATLKWDETVSGPVDQIEYTGIYGESSLHWQINELSGSVTDNGAAADGKTRSCTASFNPSTSDGGRQGVSLPLDEPGAPAFPVLATNPDYSVIPPRGLPSSLIAVKVTSEVGADPNCSSLHWNDNGNEAWGFAATFGASPAQQSAWYDAAAPSVYFPPGSSYTQPVDYSYTCGKANNCGTESGKSGVAGSTSATLSSTIGFSSPGLPSASSTQTPITRVSPPSGPGPYGPPMPYDWLPEGKRQARTDLDPALENARDYCTPYALGVGEFGTGVLLTGAPGVGLTLTVAGSLTALAAEPFCIATLRRVADDYRRYRDPPDANFHVVARPTVSKPVKLPSCKRWSGSAQRFCKQLRPVEIRWADAAARVAAIDDALSTTTNRDSAALAAHDTNAAAQQSAAGRTLQAQESAALAEKSTAGAALAAVLRARRIRFHLTRAQSRRTIDAVERTLAKQGIATSALTPLAGRALAPGAVDLLRALAG